jgi:hypothetical protein
VQRFSHGQPTTTSIDRRGSFLDHATHWSRPHYFAKIATRPDASAGNVQTATSFESNDGPRRGPFRGRSRFHGLGDAKAIKKLGQIFGLHSLALENVVNVHQRAKVESYDEHLFIVASMAKLKDQQFDTANRAVKYGHWERTT